MTDLSGVSDQELIAALERRHQRGPGLFLPPHMFMHVVGWYPNVTAAALVVRRVGAETQILLSDRQPTDIGHDGTCHMPAKFMLLGETTDAHIKRILANDVGITRSVNRLAGHCNDPHEPRGHHYHAIYVVTQYGDYTKGRWHNLRDLPANVVAQHLPMIFRGLQGWLNVSAAPVIEYDGTATLEHWQPLITELLDLHRC